MIAVGQLFLSLLALACQVFLAGLFLGWVASRVGLFSRSKWSHLLDFVASVSRPAAFAVTTVTVAGSLFFSEIAHYPPCRLCWVQRALLYPLAPLTALLWWRPSYSWVRRLIVGLAVADLPVSAYHYVLEWFPQLESDVCNPKNPCTLVWVREFGYVSIPLMALTSALTVLVLVLLSRRSGDTTAPHSSVIREDVGASPTNAPTH